jgi:hypothetical protein
MDLPILPENLAVPKIQKLLGIEGPLTARDKRLIVQAWRKHLWMMQALLAGKGKVDELTIFGSAFGAGLKLGMEIMTRYRSGKVNELKN